jgi:hypothetical protein
MKEITRKKILNGGFNKNVKYHHEGNLDLTGCTGLTALPDNLSVGGWLDLTGCTGLTALPDNLSVGGWLYLTGCTGLTGVVTRENLGENDRTGYAFNNKGDVYFVLGCHFDNFENTLNAVGVKYGNNSDYANAIIEMKKELE